ncbi:hypothetical protein TPHV1_50083 [Treponema phagedenis]|uniref:Uncharacterized protein n=1 Tax=Treponema phagedenis TaxID=162 RepID=A0A0B7GWD3_TREPH|nr:hypothetical protein TPHV1_50083 [Treponema phagedenis]
MEKVCAFKTSFLRGTMGVRARSEFAVRGKMNPASFKALQTALL